MPENIKGQISIAVGNENAIQRLAEVEAAVKRVTEARKKDLEIARQTGGSGVSPASSHPTVRPSGGSASSLVPQSKEIKASTVSLEKFNGERLKQLQIQQQINRIGEASTTVRQIQEQVQANEGLVRVLTRRQSKMREGSKEYIEMSKHIDNLNKNIKKGGEEILKESIAAEKAKKAITGLSTEKQKNTKHTLAARLAAKLFHTEMGDGSLQMMKYGIIAAGAASAMKLIRYSVEREREQRNELVRMGESNRASLREAFEYRNARYQDKLSAYDTLIDVSQRKKSDLSAGEQVNMYAALKTLGMSVNDIDGTLGATNKLLEMRARVEKAQKDDRERTLEMEIKSLKNSLSQDGDLLKNTYLSTDEHVAKHIRDSWQGLVGKNSSLRERLSGFNGLFPGPIIVEAIRGGVADKIYTAEVGEVADRIERNAKTLRERESELKRLRMELSPEEKLKASQKVAAKQAEQKLESTFSSALKSLSAEIGKFRVTAQQAVEANSLEGIRLESRRFLNANLPEDKSLAHVQSLDANVKNLAANMTSFGSKLDRLLNYTSNLTKLGGTITYG